MQAARCVFLLLPNENCWTYSWVHPIWVESILMKVLCFFLIYCMCWYLILEECLNERLWQRNLSSFIPLHSPCLFSFPSLSLTSTCALISYSFFTMHRWCSEVQRLAKSYIMPWYLPMQGIGLLAFFHIQYLPWWKWEHIELSQWCFLYKDMIQWKVADAFPCKAPLREPLLY